MLRNMAATAPARSSFGSVTINIDPEAFKIIDGKLYLIYDEGTRMTFRRERERRRAEGDANWPKIKADLELTSITEARAPTGPPRSERPCLS